MGELRERDDRSPQFSFLSSVFRQPPEMSEQKRLQNSTKFCVVFSP
jgi:hypothetical protein